MSDGYDSGPSSPDFGGGYSPPPYDPPSRPDPAPAFSRPYEYPEPVSNPVPPLASGLEDTYRRTTPEPDAPRHGASSDREGYWSTTQDIADLPEPSAEPTVRESSSQVEEWLGDEEEDPDTDAGFLAWLDATSSRSSADSSAPAGRLPRLAARHAKEPKALRAATSDGGWVAVVPDSAGRVVATRHFPDGRRVRLDSVRDLLVLEESVLEPWVPLPASPGWAGDLEVERDSWPQGIPEEVRDLLAFHATRAQALRRTLVGVESRTGRLVAEVESADTRADALRVRTDAAERDLDHVRAARVDAERRLRISLAVSAVLTGLLVSLALVWFLTA